MTITQLEGFFNAALEEEVENRRFQLIGTAISAQGSGDDIEDALHKLDEMLPKSTAEVEAKRLSQYARYGN